MKTHRLLLAAALALSAAACSGDVTAPEADVRAGDVPALNTETPEPEVISDPTDDSGNLGSGCCPG